MGHFYNFNLQSRQCIILTTKKPEHEHVIKFLLTQMPFEKKKKLIQNIQACTAKLDY